MAHDHRTTTPVDHEGGHDQSVDALPLAISCDDCAGQGSAHCDDCLVTFVCGHQEGTAVVIDVAEYRAMRLLADGGLVPRLRHRRRTG